MIRFIHTADIHFGVENYGRVDQHTGIHTRLLDFERALNACIDTAIAHKVDFFLFSGDAYKTAHPTPTQQRLLFRCFLRLYQHNIPLIIIVGCSGISWGRLVGVGDGIGVLVGALDGCIDSFTLGVLVFFGLGVFVAGKVGVSVGSNAVAGSSSFEGS